MGLLPIRSDLTLLRPANPPEGIVLMELEERSMNSSFSRPLKAPDVNPAIPQDFRISFFSPGIPENIPEVERVIPGFKLNCRLDRELRPMKAPLAIA